MTTDDARFILASEHPDLPSPVLTRVDASGRLDASLFELTLRQTYRNAGSELLEVIYTFPLAPQAVLLGFASELNGARQEGQIVARQAAEAAYEASLEQGDAPVMLKSQGNGLHTANIGNLKPGDEIVLEVRYAQLLAFEQGRLRVAIPQTIAPRYGSAALAGFEPQDVPAASLFPEYPLALRLAIGPALAGAALECPTHQISVRPDKDGIIWLELAPGATLDRDVIVTLTPKEAHPSLLVRATDPFDSAAPVLAMAAFQSVAGARREAITLKVLVDCSGSMGGDSIASARAALRGVMRELTERDRLSLTRFGSTVEHVFAPAAARAQVLRHLRGVIDTLQADLGGTEMQAALDAVFALPGNADCGGDVLLVTDGEIWQADPMIEAARQSGHRVFAIGVGSAPAEGVLRRLAEATGGACEFATPGEQLEAAAQRMLARIRQQPAHEVRAEWSGKPMWTFGPTGSVFGGDTVYAFAAYTAAPAALVARLVATGAAQEVVELARSEASAPVPGDALARMAAAQRLADTTDSALALDLALRYQLLTRQTHCILVHERAEADKAVGESKTHRVGSMLAAGWGGSGVVARSAGKIRSLEAKYHVSGDLVFCQLTPSTEHLSIANPEPDFVTSVIESLRAQPDAAGIAQASRRSMLPPMAETAIDQVKALGLNESDAWLLLAMWWSTRDGSTPNAELGALTTARIDAIDPSSRAEALHVFDVLIGTAMVGRSQRPSNRLDRLEIV